MLCRYARTLARDAWRRAESKTWTHYGSVGSGRHAAGRQVGAGLGRTARCRVDPAKSQTSFFVLEQIERQVPDVFSEARTNNIELKPMEERNECLTNGLSAVYPQDRNNYLFLAADKCTDAYLSLYTFFMQRMSGNQTSSPKRILFLSKNKAD